jgi:hypothetical protein
MTCSKVSLVASTPTASTQLVDQSIFVNMADELDIAIIGAG